MLRDGQSLPFKGASNRTHKYVGGVREEKQESLGEAEGLRRHLVDALHVVADMVLDGRERCETEAHDTVLNACYNTMGQ